nr:hypothetical protein [Actinomycetota bacterium]
VLAVSSMTVSAAAIANASTGQHRASRLGDDKSSTRRVWAVTHNGAIRCSARFPNHDLVPGRKTHVRFSVTNLTDREKKVGGEGELRFEDQARNELWHAGRYYEGPALVTAVEPHETVRLPSFDARVRWSGPLYVTPECSGLDVHMPQLRFDVSQPGAPDSDSDAIDAAVSVPGSPFQSCHPGPHGEARTGSFAPPTGRNDPDMTLRCWAEIRHEHGFDVVGLNMVSPEDAPYYTIDERSGTFPPPMDLPGEGNFLAGHWGFVVTSSDARGYISQTQTRTVGNGTAYECELQDGSWTDGGHSICGFDGSIEDPFGNTFSLYWLPNCSG